jgi:hypothetical protein
MLQMTSFRIPSGPAAVAALLALVACSSVSPGGFLAASRLDPVITDPAALTTAIGISDRLRLKTGDAVLRFSFTLDGAAAPDVDESFILQVTPAAGADPAPLEGEAIYTARIATADHDRLRAAQARVGAAKAAGVTGSGSIAVDIRGACHVGGVPDALPVRTFLRTDPADPFVLLTRQADILRLLDPTTAAALRANMPAC